MSLTIDASPPAGAAPTVRRLRPAIGLVLLAVGLAAINPATLSGTATLVLAGVTALIVCARAWRRPAGYLAPAGLPLGYALVLHVLPLLVADRFMFEGASATVASGVVSPAMADDPTTRALGVFLLGLVAMILIVAPDPVSSTVLRARLDRPLGPLARALRVTGRSALLASIALQGLHLARNGVTRDAPEGLDAELTTMGRLALFMGAAAIAVASGDRRRRRGRLPLADLGLLVTALGLAFTWGSRSTLLAPALLLVFVLGARRILTGRRLLAAALAGVIVLVGVAELRRDGPESINGVGLATVPERVVRDLNAPTYLTFYTLRAHRLDPLDGPTGGSSYVAAVPRLLPSAATAGFGWDLPPLGTTQYRELIEFDDPRRGFGFATVTEGVLNFGFVGAFGSGVATGLALAWSYRLLVIGGTGLVARWLYPVLFASLPWFLRSDVLQGAKPPLYAIALLGATALATRIAARGAGRRPGPDRDPAVWRRGAPATDPRRQPVPA